MRRANTHVTSNDVARLAGVSQSAVSRAFTPGAPISAETRTRIIATAREIGYVPSSLMRWRARGSNEVAIVTADITNPFRPEILEILSARLRGRGLTVRLYSLSRASEIDSLAFEIFRDPLAGVLLLSATVSTNLARICRERRLPIVLLNRILPNPDVSMVASDNYAGGRQVAELLLRTGCKRVAFMAGRASIPSSAERERGLADGLSSGGQTIYAVENGQFVYEDALDAARRLLSRSPHPDAIFCANDVMALATLYVARQERGLRVPEDVSVVGFDDIHMASWPAYNLTTVRQRLDLIVDEAIDLLQRLIANPESSGATRLITGVLVERGTTPPAGPDVR